MTVWHWAGVTPARHRRLLVCRALERLGAIAHIAEPAETSALRGRKRRARPTAPRPDGCGNFVRQPSARDLATPRARAPVALARPAPQHAGRQSHQLDPADPRHPLLPRYRWCPDELRAQAGRQFLAILELPVDAHERVTIALELIGPIDAQLAELERDLRAFAVRQSRCQALMARTGWARSIAGHAVRARERHTTALPPAKPPRMAASHRRAPLRPPRPAGQTHSPRLRARALGVIRGSPIGQPRLRRVSRAQAPRARAHPRLQRRWISSLNGSNLDRHRRPLIPRRLRRAHRPLDRVPIDPIPPRELLAPHPTKKMLPTTLGPALDVKHTLLPGSINETLVRVTRPFGCSVIAHHRDAFSTGRRVSLPPAPTNSTAISRRQMPCE